MRNSENNENAIQSKTLAASSAKGLGLKATSGNVLRQGAKRSALSDVSNRVPHVTETTGKSAVEISRKSQLTRPLRRENPSQAISSIAEHDGSDTELSDKDSDAENDAMKVDSPHATASIARTSLAVVEPAYTKQDRLELQRVADEFVDEWDEWGDISMVQEYADDIFTHMHELEVNLSLFVPRTTS